MWKYGILKVRFEHIGNQNFLKMLNIKLKFLVFFLWVYFSNSNLKNRIKI